MVPASPLVVVIAGPNGAGKSTTATHLLRDALEVVEFVNADSIAAGLSAFRPESVTIAAGRIMLRRMRQLAETRASFAFETTLASRNFAPWLSDLRRSGYRAHIAFLSLPSAELALARVAERVRLGGHDMPEDVVRRRFAAGVRNFFTLYDADRGHLASARQLRVDWPPSDRVAPRRGTARGRRSRSVEDLSGAPTMTSVPEPTTSPADRVEDLPRILRAMRAAVREAVERHRRAGHPVAVWRNDRVEWIRPEDLPVAEPEPGRERE